MKDYGKLIDEALLEFPANGWIQPYERENLPQAVRDFVAQFAKEVVFSDNLLDRVEPVVEAAKVVLACLERGGQKQAMELEIARLRKAIEGYEQ